MFRKKKLDYLLIPDSSKETKKEREKRAIKELKNRKVKKILILKGNDSEEDILYLGKILKKGYRVGFDTFPLHYKEYKEIIKKAKRDKKFPKGIKIENVKTKQSFKQYIYGCFGLGEEKLKERKLAYMKNREEKLIQFVKNFLKKILS